MLSKRQRPYDAESLPASARLRRNLGDLLARNELAANRVGEVVNDIHRVAPRELRDLAGPLGTHTARRLRGKFLKRSTWMPDYVASLRCWDPKSHTIVHDQVPMQLIHEVVAVLLKHGFREKLLAKDHFDPLSLQHLLSCEAQAMCELLGIGIWGDGAPTQWDRGESIDVISLSLPGLAGDYRNLRIPLLVLPHSRMCSETWTDVFAIIKWSLTILATGVWPTARHDGSAWAATDKSRVAARPLLKGALVEVRQDWKFAAEVFGFPSHNTAAGCCWACKCTPAEVHGVPDVYIHTYVYIYIYIYTYIFINMCIFVTYTCICVSAICMLSTYMA